MAHFALVDGDIVRQVITVDNADCGGGNFPESEPLGQAFIATLGLAGEWLQTSYHANFRQNYAGVGFYYDRTNDCFAPPIVKEIEPINE